MSRKIRSLQAIVLCEGKDDVDTIEAIVSKMEIQIASNVALSECGGVCKLKELASVVATLASLSRKMSTIALVIDLDNQSIRNRLDSLINSLRAHSVTVEDPTQLGGSIFSTSKGDLKILIKIVGRTDLTFTRHEMEDYSVNLLLLRKEIQATDIQGFEKPSEYMEHVQMKPVDVISRSSDAEVKQAYDNIIKLISFLAL